MSRRKPASIARRRERMRKKGDDELTRALQLSQEAYDTTQAQLSKRVSVKASGVSDLVMVSVPGDGFCALASIAVAIKGTRVDSKELSNFIGYVALMVASAPDVNDNVFFNKLKQLENLAVEGKGALEKLWLDQEEIKIVAKSLTANLRIFSVPPEVLKKSLSDDSVMDIEKRGETVLAPNRPTLNLLYVGDHFNPLLVDGGQPISSIWTDFCHHRKKYYGKRKSGLLEKLSLPPNSKIKSDVKSLGLKRGRRKRKRETASRVSQSAQITKVEFITKDEFITILDKKMRKMDDKIRKRMNK